VLVGRGLLGLGIEYRQRDRRRGDLDDRQPAALGQGGPTDLVRPWRRVRGRRRSGRRRHRDRERGIPHPHQLAPRRIALAGVRAVCSGPVRPAPTAW